MKEKSIVITAATGLILGSVLGMAGSIVSTAVFRNLAWAMGSTGLILASTFLTVYYFRKGYDTIAVGFLIYAIAEAVVFSSCATDLDSNIPAFSVGTLLWAVSIAIISLHKLFPIFVRVTGVVAAASFAVVSVLILTGHSVNPLTKPLPFFGYPFFAATLIGWGWTTLKNNFDWSKA